MCSLGSLKHTSVGIRSPFVIWPPGTWPLDEQKNKEDAVLDNSPVVGYEPFVVADLFVAVS